MSEERIRAEAASHSDHQARIISELEPALRDTAKGFDALEIGNRDGGSALFIMWFLKPRLFVTVDVQPSPPILAEWEKELGIKHIHEQARQEDFIKMTWGFEWSFIFLDADHEQASVTRDIKLLIPRMVKGAVLVVDDVQEWTSFPEFEGLERVDYHVDEGQQFYKSGHHVLYYRRV